MKQGKARGQRATMCGATRIAKIRYRTLKDAKVARGSRVARGEAYLRIYKCPACRGHHLTSQVREITGGTPWVVPQRAWLAAA